MKVGTLLNNHLDYELVKHALEWLRSLPQKHQEIIILVTKWWKIYFRELYHIGASIKDAGKKAFEISINDDEKLLAAILERL